MDPLKTDAVMECLILTHINAPLLWLNKALEKYQKIL